MIYWFGSLKSHFTQTRPSRRRELRQRRRLTAQSLENRRMMAADLGNDLGHGDPGHVHVCGPGCGCASDHSHDDIARQIDTFGNIFYADPLPTADELSQIDTTGLGSAGTTYPASASVPVAGGVPALSSMPGADQTIFLDFDGEVVENTYWNSRNDNLPIHAAAYDIDGDASRFSGAELNRIEEIFRRVAEDFAPFDVNVTTVDPGDAAFTAGGRALRTLISTDVDDAATGGTGNSWYSNAGGVAYLNSWNWRSDTPVWVFENRLGNGNEKYVAEAASHEVGHAFGLRHDGTGSVGYYRGHGSGQTGWAPIMGVGYNRALTQWSRGEYADANQWQDDFAIIANQLGLRVDDHGDALATSTGLTLDADGTFTAGGIISTADDVDAFSFQTAGGDFSLELLPFDLGDGKANLDAAIELIDAAGSVLAISNPIGGLSASLAATLAAGVYWVSVDGVGQGDPAGTGYSDYGSLGQYLVTGSFIAGDDSNGGGGEPPADPTLITFDAADLGSYGGSQDISGQSTVTNGGTTLTLAGNSWRQIGFDYVVTASTVLQFEYRTESLGEIHGIGLDTDLSISSDRTFRLDGTQNWGIAVEPIGQSDGWSSFRIEVGNYYRGGVDTLFFVNDHDTSNPTASGSLRNLRVFEPGNTAPVAAVDTATTVAGTPVIIDVLVNDSDPDDDSLTIGDVTEPDNGSVRIDGNRLVYTPRVGFVGTDEFQYVVDDERGGLATGTVTITIDPPSGNDTIDFNSVTTNGYGGDQDKTGDPTVAADGSSLTIMGNGWKAIDFDYDITPDTVLRFDFSSSEIGEIHGIGFDTDDSISANRTFRVAGSQNWGIDGPTYDGGVVTYEIAVGTFYTGSVSRLFFVNDIDANGRSANGTFANVSVFDSGSIVPDADDDATASSIDPLLDRWRRAIDGLDGRLHRRLTRRLDRIEAWIERLDPPRRRQVEPLAQRWLGRSDGRDSLADYASLVDSLLAGLR